MNINDASLTYSNAQDIHGIIQLHKIALPHLKWSYNEKYVSEMLNDNFDSTTSRCYSLIKHGEVIGCVHYYIEKTYVWLNTIAILPEYQGRGFGRKMIQFIEQDVLDLGLPHMIKFWTLKNQPAGHLKYYESMGYKRFGRDRIWQGLKKKFKISLA